MTGMRIEYMSWGGVILVPKRATGPAPGPAAQGDQPRRATAPRPPRSKDHAPSSRRDGRERTALAASAGRPVLRELELDWGNLDRERRRLGRPTMVGLFGDGAHAAAASLARRWRAAVILPPAVGDEVARRAAYVAAERAIAAGRIIVAVEPGRGFRAEVDRAPGHQRTIAVDLVPEPAVEFTPRAGFSRSTWVIAAK